MKISKEQARKMIGWVMFNVEDMSLNEEETLRKWIEIGFVKE